jgi:hypothetical protein
VSTRKQRREGRDRVSLLKSPRGKKKKWEGRMQYCQ